MRAHWWFRISALLFLLFAAGHTVGFLTFHAPSAEGRAVWEAMNSTRFSDGSHSYSYADFYQGFGLFITVYFLFTAWLVWILGSQESRAILRPVAWPLIVAQLACVALALHYFSIVQASFSGLTAITLMLGTLAAHRQKGTPKT